MIYYAIIWFIMIYYAINMISYTLKRFTIQLIDFVNNILALVEGFNRYQIFGKKKSGARESNPGLCD